MLQCSYYMPLRIGCIYNTYIYIRTFSDKNPDELFTLSEQLYQALSEGQLLGKACKRRPAMLKTVFKLLDLATPRLLLKLARLILAVRTIYIKFTSSATEFRNFSGVKCSVINKIFCK